ncbi:hypothetical protein [Bacillus subtilis]|uniref:hypothetical protein n=1 Tax=Bacillus subtilis TaxID=1423 RepID=UPI0016047C8C|nr:hypothetical protein [Bacillus subtilis]
MSSKSSASADFIFSFKIIKLFIAIAALLFKITNEYTISFGIFTEPILKFFLLLWIWALPTMRLRVSVF